MKRQKIKRGASQTYDTPSFVLSLPQPNRWKICYFIKWKAILEILSPFAYISIYQRVSVEGHLRPTERTPSTTTGNKEKRKFHIQHEKKGSSVKCVDVCHANLYEKEWKQTMLGGQVCYLPSDQAAQYLGFPTANDSHSIIFYAFLLIGQVTNLPSQHLSQNSRNTFILSMHLTE